MSIKWYQDDNGKTSLMRLVIAWSALLGGACIICGLVGFFFSNPDTIALVGAGTILIGIGEGAKAAQKKIEVGK